LVAVIFDEIWPLHAPAEVAEAIPVARAAQEMEGEVTPDRNGK
jgi:hypothetical protein